MDVTKDKDAILEELNSLREAVRLESSSATTSGLVLMRQFAGLGLKQWETIASRQGFRDWLALPLDDDPLPYLTRIQETIRELSYLTEHDHLTKLSNRGAFDRALKSELDRAHRGATSLSLVILDLDDFKKINDTYGHPCGDEVLKAAAQIIYKAKRTYDYAARLGGEEFALILPGVGMTQAEAMLDRLLQNIRALEVSCPGIQSPVRVTISAGLACTKGKLPISTERIVGLADKALYQAKSQGKDQVVKAPIVDLAAPPDRTIVRADEKKFLFTGLTKG